MWLLGPGHDNVGAADQPRVPALTVLVFFINQCRLVEVQVFCPTWSGQSHLQTTRIAKVHESCRMIAGFGFPKKAARQIAWQLHPGRRLHLQPSHMMSLEPVETEKKASVAIHSWDPDMQGAPGRKKSKSFWCQSSPSSWLQVIKDGDCQTSSKDNSWELTEFVSVEKITLGNVYIQRHTDGQEKSRQQQCESCCDTATTTTLTGLVCPTCHATLPPSPPHLHHKASAGWPGKWIHSREVTLFLAPVTWHSTSYSFDTKNKSYFCVEPGLNRKKEMTRKLAYFLLDFKWILFFFPILTTNGLYLHFSMVHRTNHQTGY